MTEPLKSLPDAVIRKPLDVLVVDGALNDTQASEGLHGLSIHVQFDPIGAAEEFSDYQVGVMVVDLGHGVGGLIRKAREIDAAMPIVLVTSRNLSDESRRKILDKANIELVRRGDSMGLATAVNHFSDRLYSREVDSSVAEALLHQH